MEPSENNEIKSGAAKAGSSLLVLEAKAAGAGAKAGAGAGGRARLNSPGAAQARQFAAMVGAIALSLGVGWFVGGQTAALSQARAQRAAFDAVFVSEMNRHAQGLAALDQRLALAEAQRPPSNAAETTRALDALARRFDEAGRAQAAAASLADAQLERLEADLALRLDRMEKQASASKSAPTPAAAATPAQAVTVQAATQAATQPPAPKPADRTIVEKAGERAGEKPLRAYVLREVFRGGALVEGRRGLVEAVPGVELPGAGRVRSVERRDGRWVVVTTAGVIDGE